MYFTPAVAADGVPEVFMHCPWASGAGVAYADYSLRLPRTDRIRVSFEIGLRPGAVGSDGVTYRIYADGKVLFDEHCTARQFLLREADLSASSDKEITLRLEVDPGPACSTTDDWSLWRNIQILAGDDEQLAEARRQAEAEAARRRAEMLARARELADLPLGALTSHHSHSVCPSVAEPTRVSVRAEGDSFIFECEGDGESIQYRFSPAKGLWAGLSVTANGKLLKPAPFSGGPVVHLDETDLSALAGQVTAELVSSELKGARLTCEYRYVNPETGSSARLQAVLWTEGKSLGLDVTGEPDRFSGFGAYANGGMPVARPFSPRCPDPVAQ